MDEDWDLHAVVRGFATVTNNPISAADAATDYPFPVSNSLPFLNSENSFDIPGLFDDKNDPFLGLHEIYQELCVESHPSPPPPATVLGATATSPVTHALQPHDQSVQIQPLHVQMNTQQLRNTSFPSPLSFPSNSQPIRQRRRKNQQTKMIREMTQEELAADAWAWRKYGQKPIKGSPYPRNYYRCSTSKGCAARKQVERSLNDPAVFVVSYTGEHTHPRPIHRSSLAGSTRNRLAPTSLQIKNNNNIDGTNKNNKNALSLPMGSLSSPGSGSSFSSSTPTNEGEPVEQNEDVEMVEEAGEEDNDGGNEADDIDDNIMMINDLMMNDEDDIFKGFQESDQSSGGDLFSSGMLMSPPWTPIAAAAFDDEGCD